MTLSGRIPVIMGFHDMFRLHASVPSLLPSMTYHEHSVGIPYCYVTQGGAMTARTPGPYYFMPILLLDNAVGGARRHPVLGIREAARHVQRR